MVPTLVDLLWTLAAVPEGLSHLVLGGGASNLEFQLMILSVWKFAGNDSCLYMFLPGMRVLPYFAGFADTTLTLVAGHGGEGARECV